MKICRSIAAVALTCLLPSAALGDVVFLHDGDRITGRILSDGPRTVRIQTPYGRLLIPRSKIERIERDDGTKWSATPSPTPAPSPPVPEERRVRLVLVITGKTFWQAWSGPPASIDPTLRLEVRLDEETVATYIDQTLDPDIPGATVNSFSFAADHVTFVPGPGVVILPPEARPGRIVLKMDIRRGPARRRFGLAYQSNSGSASSPEWRDLAATTTELQMPSDGNAFVQVLQERGQMEFSGFPKRKMKNVETFRIEARPES